MSGRVQYPVFIIATTDDKEQAKNVARMFDDDAFVVNILSAKIPTTLPKYGKSNSEEVIASYRFEQACREADKRYSTQDSLIIFDSSTTNVSPSRILEILQALKESTPADLYYLADWLDKMDLSDELIHLKTKDRRGREIRLNTVARRTQSPNGLQAILLTPKVRQIILGEITMDNDKYFTPLNNSMAEQLRENIEKGNLVAVAIYPNIFSFDIAQAKDVGDLMKTNSFSPFRDTLGSNATPLPVLWFFLVVFLIILLSLGGVALRNVYSEPAPTPSKSRRVRY